MQRPAVGVAVLVIKGNVLLLGRRKSSHGIAYWSFPGGHLEFGESIQECAKRELLEETGLIVANLRYGPFTNDYFADEQKHYVTLYVLADHIDGDPEVREPEKNDCWTWYCWDDLPTPLFLPIRNLLALGMDLKTLQERSIPIDPYRQPQGARPAGA